MVKVLQNWQEIGNSILTLQSKGLPTHATAQKNWDHSLLCKMLASSARQCMIVDLGCGDGHTLALLHALGFNNIHGVDLQIDWRPRARQVLTMWREKTLKPPYRLRRGNITKTPFQPETFDIAISISTIEHGVDVESFLTEALRILKPGGLLFITTDYWEDKILTESSSHVYGLPWQIFCRDQIENMIRSAQEVGLDLSDQTGIPHCSDRPILWQNSNYTFIAMLFRKACS
jgi:SAM-dependent methyltransferase